MNLFSRKPPDDKRLSETAITMLVEVLKTDPDFGDMTAERLRAAAVGMLHVKAAAEEGRFDDDRRPE